MASQINPTFPIEGAPTTASVRNNFATAANEISALQVSATGAPFLPLAGAQMRGPINLFNDPTAPMHPVTLGYFLANGGGGGGGGGGVPEAPADGTLYGRLDGSWSHAVSTDELDTAINAAPFLRLTGGTLTGSLVVAHDPVQALEVATKSYTDTHFLALTGGTLSGALILPGTPTQALAAVPRQFIDNQAFIPQIGPSSRTVVVLDNTNTTDRTPVLAGPITPYNGTSDGIKIQAKALAAVGAGGVWADGPGIHFHGPATPTTANSVALQTGNNAAGYNVWTFAANGMLYTPGPIQIAGTAVSADPLILNAPNGMNARTIYNVASTRQWSCGVVAAGYFAIADESGAIARLTIDTAGGATLNGSITCTGNMWLNGGGADPLHIVSSPGQAARGRYVVGGMRDYSCGVNPDGHFWVADETGGIGILAVYNSSAGQYVATSIQTAFGIMFSGTGLGYVYRLRYDGTSLYCYVNDVPMAIGQASSRTIKREIVPVTIDALTQVRAVPMYSYTQDIGPSDDPTETHFDCGWMAEDLEEHITNSVTRVKPDAGSHDESLFPIWQPILAYTFRALQQLADSHDALTARLAALEAKG